MRIAIVVPEILILEHQMKNFLKFRHGKTEGEANNTLGMLLLAVIAITYRLSPWLLGAAGGYYWWLK